MGGGGGRLRGWRRSRGRKMLDPCLYSPRWSILVNMRATLTLDDDVTALLERAKREQGESLQDLANDLLRRTLKRVGKVARGLSSRSASEDIGPVDGEPLGRERGIEQLYGEIHDLVARLESEPHLRPGILRKREELTTLEAQEAELFRRRAEARRRLSPGEGAQAVDRAKRALER